MKTFKMQKLVRDKIVDNILSRGGKVDLKKLDKKQFLTELKKKLGEETQEFNTVSFDNLEEIKNELADVQLIIDSILNTLKISKKDLNKTKKYKNKKVGEFKKKIFVNTVSLANDDKEWIEYYRRKGFEEIK